ncbi:hypothetical protein [Methylobacterium nodulans]|uniref:Uncharacterized protein n=1 Tax=Methylobacterium nodulans (strain LMG 21967 / CNCM I-2342 / ORS 2060) TaxID=460265 RepID=B8IBI5_METNO|nr:hypothetical protein [Methylobacterium nodulans]ACL59239.1 hypothetical protein Mnod_4368 [Methylobacterium nodulans ORS 2060]
MDGELVQYNLFRNAQKRELYCAVPTWMPVPSFIRMPVWRYAAAVRAPAEMPRGFLPAAARQAARWNGYYLFHAWGCERMFHPEEARLPDAA